MICKVFLLRGVCDIIVFFLIYLLSIIFLMLHYLVFKVQFLRICFLLISVWIYADSGFSPTLPRTCVRKAEEKSAWCVNSAEIGGDEENRTPDPLLARQVLSQLSYTPKFELILRHKQLAVHTYCLRCFFLVWAANCRSFVSFALIFRRLCVSRDRRVHMVRKGYENIQDTKNLVGLSGLEPPTSRLSGVRSNRLSYRPIGLLMGFSVSFPTSFSIKYSLFQMHNILHIQK